MSRYLRWNDTIAQRFFNPDMAGRTVHLYVNRRLVSDLEQDLGASAGAFVDAVLEGPPWTTRNGICQHALQACQGWRARGLPFPPYIGYLGLFVLAGGAEGDFGPHAYYPRLRELLGEPGDGRLPSFHRMHELWDDLETWSELDTAGKLGLFRSRSIGGQIHIGYPLAQSLLTEQERKALPGVFYNADLDPTVTPSAEELARALRSSTSRHLLRPRTVRLVEDRNDDDQYTALLDVVADELAEWDGAVVTSNVGGRPNRLASAGLRIGLDLDPVAKTASASLRCKLNREFPEEGIDVVIPGYSERFIAQEYMDNWSLPVATLETGEYLDASRLDWKTGLTLSPGQTGLRLRLPGRPIRIFEDGISEGIPGLIEVHALPRAGSFYLAYSDHTWSQLAEWATTECRDFEHLELVSGLPRGWRLARVAEATGTDRVHDEFPFLSFPPGIRVLLVGGVRSASGNSFFSFAPPDVALEGGGV